MKSANNFESSMRDWSAGDRAKFLRSIPAPKRHKDAFIAPGLSVRGLCGTDVSGMDRRSVKAQLAGRGDFRASWWALNHKVHQFFKPGASLEEVMYSFHKRHHAVTLFVLGVARDYWVMFHKIRNEGAGAALRFTVDEVRKGHGIDR